MNDTNLPTVEQLLEAADRKVEELERAIFCLPKPPEGMGDGPDERVANVIFLLQKARGKRAEVLAACANKVETTIYYREVDVLEWDAARLQQQIANDIRQLQPAASSLEELLRQEREKVAREVVDIFHAYQKGELKSDISTLGAISACVGKYISLTDTELEKAREEFKR